MISTFRTLYPYLVRYRWSYAAGGAALFVGSAFAAAVPLVVREAVDRFVSGASPAELQAPAALVVAAVFAKGVFRFISRSLIAGSARRVELDLRGDLFLRIISFSRKFFASYRTGDLTSRAVNDLTAIRVLLGQGLSLMFDLSLTFIWALAVMSAVDWRLTCAIFAPLPLISLTVSYFGRKIHSRFHAVQGRLGGLTSAVEQNISNARLVRAYSSGGYANNHFDQLNGLYYDENMQLVGLWRRMYPTMELLIGVGYVVVLIYGGFRVLDGELSVGSFVMFVAYMAMLTWPMIGLGWVVNLIQRGSAALERVNEILSRRAVIADGPATDSAIDGVRGDLSLSGVSYFHPGADQPALDDVTLDVPVGQTVAIVGPVGSGKSTLLDLVPRLIEPASGVVRIDGEDLERIPIAVLRGSIGLARQEPFLLNMTLGENLLFGAPGPLEQWQIDEAVEIAALTETVESLPQGYEARVGERGVKLSGGQRQRAALVRAVLREPRFLLLDDALSSVDAETEAGIIENLRRFLRNRTTLIATHRLSAARRADRVVVLEHGRIVEDGTHDDLVESRGRYWDLWRKQSLEEELEHNE